MATIEDSLNAYLSAQAAITTLVSNRVAPMQASQNMSFPRIIYAKSTDVPFYHMSGDGLVYKSEFLVECQASTIGDAENVRDAVKPYINGFKGAMGSRTCLACFIRDEFDTNYPIVHGDESGIKAKSFLIELFYR